MVNLEGVRRICIRVFAPIYLSEAEDNYIPLLFPFERKLFAVVSKINVVALVLLVSIITS
ncbi:hypothetical protein METBIDRAFT_31160 [Metschnikowia bicuspidata var. bicuspidata NRRL YB-4993]|uniref:Uncharacterized protein n=1 Tax=Metschnikowia bicuspidata var. bicuspidata NRRL YB-4993 TaxID=869754 RepID=A0A1A0HE95_9ASCO|nr:hypothetical protein METBIDRAFT_31160 [Metschnikowia bicuspidata var. bicuspidata NRRL YB-4993]OBA22222.1 hypothetical protein METBIDRAFT_31160 [Metschnikowia bicuspidata var. bicuspidata NRRL YB-4993]